MRHRQRALGQRVCVDHLVDAAPRQRGVDIIGRSAESKFRQMPARHGKAHDLESERWKRHADQELGDADAAATPRHDAAVGATGEHAAAGNGVAVDRRHHRSGMEKDRVVDAVQTRQEFTHIFGAAGGHLQQVDAGGEDSAPPGDDHRARVAPAQFRKTPRQRVTQPNIERICFAMVNGNGGNSVVCLDIDHCLLAPVFVAASGINRIADAENG